MAFDGDGRNDFVGLDGGVCILFTCCFLVDPGDDVLYLTLENFFIKENSDLHGVDALTKRASFGLGVLGGFTLFVEPLVR